MTASKTQFLAAQLDRGIVHVYSWGKDIPKSKMILPEKIRSFKISPSGTWCVGGSESGKLFLWEVHLDANTWIYIRSLAGTCYSLEKHIISL
jgi:pre-rRNA-processing protein IPI3